MAIAPNRLISEASPYLRLHAHNPVDWYPWGEAAFARAREERKPIFLSIGYFTCHWCHVMERECFADAGIAAQLNRDFVAVKVDREERPDIDRLYMAYVQASTGGGGWPMSVFLTPELKPFYGGTYFPPRDGHGHPGFPRLLAAIAGAWHAEPDRVREAAEQAGATLAELTAPAAGGGGAEEYEAVWERLYEQLAQSYDEVEGGFGGPPKFPRPVVLAFLLRYHHRHEATAKGRKALAMTEHTLRAMARGGMCDQLGGGFHRYATDGGWLVPHFEKMLYDQAQLAIAYLEAWQITHAAEYAAVVRATLDYTLAEMEAPGGGFYSAQDADSPVPTSHGEGGGEASGEGAYYLWTGVEIAAALDADTAALFAYHYGVKAAGNVAAALDGQGEFGGRNILHAAGTVEVTAAHFGLGVEEAAGRLGKAAEQLYQLRRQRQPPATDDKVLTAWNGLLLSALARAGSVLERADYLAAARRTAEYVRGQLYDAGTGRLYRCGEGTGRIAGFADDYAYFIQGLLDLYEAEFEPRWFEWAQALQRRQDELFAAPGGGYYSAGEDKDLWLRMREDYDGAEPSANSVAASNLMRLEGDQGRERACRLMAGLGGRLREHPEALPLLAAAMAVASEAGRDLVIAGAAGAEGTEALLRVARRRFLPGLRLWLRAPGVRWEEPPAALANLPAQASGAAAYVCQNYVCQQPVTNAEALASLLQ